MIQKNYITILVFTFFFIGNCLKVQSQNDLYGVWARKTSITAPKSGVIVKQMITDSKGNTYICGSFYGTVSLSDNTCILTNSNGYPYSGNYNGYTANNRYWDGIDEKSDGMITKYDKDGKWKWTVIVQSNVLDLIGSMVLSPDEKSIVFLTSYANSKYSAIAPGNCSITYGDGSKESITSTVPTASFFNFALVKVSTNNGGKEFYKFLGTGNSTTNGLRMQRVSQNHPDYFYLHGVQNSSGYKWFAWKYDFNGTILQTYTNPLGTVAQADVNIFSRNTSNPNLYTTIAYNSSSWEIYVVKFDPESGTSQKLSNISTYTNSNPVEFSQVYQVYGIKDITTDVNTENTHLFIAGRTLMDFVYKSTNKTITNAGGEDGIIICYDPNKLNAANNIRWMINLRAAGDQNVKDCKFDPISQTLRVVGYIDENEVDFNPLGIPMKRKSSAGKAAFCAEYNLDGRCIHITIMDAAGNETFQALDFSGENISMFGDFSGSPFQVDPSNRLIPLHTAGASNFLVKYSINPTSTPFPEAPQSYSSAQNSIVNYGIAGHDVQSCIRLGEKNNPIDNFSALLYLPKSLSGTVLNFNPNYDGISNFTIDVPLGGMSIEVKATNDKNIPAYLAAWIDFNGNGVFEKGEVSEIITVPANTINGIMQLKWNTLPTKSKTKLSTYMRVRISSEGLNGNLSEGHLADGEVEDYSLSYNLLEVSKRVMVPDPNRKAEIGDTLTYTMEVKSKINTTINLFDPIPSYTSYVANSANLGGVKGNATLEGKTVNAIIWTNQSLTKGITYSYTFKVVVDQLPTVQAATIHNIAFAIMNGDTIASNTETCNTLPIALSNIKANPDIINLFKGDGDTYSYDILANDSLGVCTKHSLDDYALITGKGPLAGSAIINSSSKELEYTPDVNYSGIDSVWYYIKCAGDSSATKVYYLIHSPLSKFYYACPHASIYLGFQTLSGVNYYWYTQEKGGTSLGAASDRILVEKDGASDKGTWWVEPVYKGIKFPRIRIDLEKAIACGDEISQAGCMTDGTIIFKEDFDSYDNGNNSSSNNYSQISLGPKTNYAFFDGIHHILGPSTTPRPNDGEYSLQKRNDPNYTTWMFYDDHTSPKDNLIGRAMIINANEQPGLFYTHVINDLCEGMQLSFSVWLGNLYTGINPNLTFSVANPANGQVLAIYQTGNIPHPANASVTNWEQYGFYLNLPAGVNSIRLDILNNAPGGPGNDFAMDDIEIRFCAPAVSIIPNVKDTLVCANSEFKFKGTYYDNGTFGNTLNYQWEYKANKTSNWTVWKQGVMGNPLTIDTTIASISKPDQGYYRLVVSNAANINSANCRAISDSIFLKVEESINITDIRVKACSEPGVNLNLSKYLYEQNFDNKWILQWTRISNYSPDIIDPVKGTIDQNLENRKHIYQYHIENNCSSGTARLYLSGINKPMDPIKQVVFCKDFAEHIHLDQIFGLEAGSIEVDVNIQKYLTLPHTPFLGATILNGKAVWEDDTLILSSYKGEPAKIVKIIYKTSSVGCWPAGTEFELEVIIVGDNFLR